MPYTLKSPYPPHVPTIAFTRNLHRHLGPDLTSPPIPESASTAAAALDHAFTQHPKLRSYILDDQGAVRRHIAVFVDGESITDRTNLSDPLPPTAEIFVLQALSGG